MNGSESQALDREGDKMLKHNGCQERDGGCNNCPLSLERFNPKFQMVIGGEFYVANFGHLRRAVVAGGLFLKPHADAFSLSSKSTNEFVVVAKMNHARNRDRLVFYGQRRQDFRPLIDLINSLRYPIKFRLDKYGKGVTGVPKFVVTMDPPKSADMRRDCESKIDEDERAALASFYEQNKVFQQADEVSRKIKILQKIEADPVGAMLIDLIISGNKNEAAKFQAPPKPKPVTCDCPECTKRRAASAFASPKPDKHAAPGQAGIDSPNPTTA